MISIGFQRKSLICQVQIQGIKSTCLEPRLWLYYFLVFNNSFQVTLDNQTLLNYSDLTAGAIYGGILLLGNLVLVSSTFYFLPFHKKRTNVFYVAFYAFTTCTAFLRLVGVLVGRKTYVYVIAWAVLSVGIVPIACGLTLWRIRTISSLSK